MIQFNDVGMRYGMGEEVLQDISFTLERGSLCFLTGASGAGKTSLLKLLYLDRKPSRGQIMMFGSEVNRVERHKLPDFRSKIGVIFQDYRLLDHLTAFDNVVLPLTLTHERNLRIEKNVQNHVKELLIWVGLEHRMYSYPSTLSGGEKQRVAIARAILQRPKLLLADEPTGNVDSVMAKRIMHLLFEMHKLGTTVLVATHDIGLADEMGASRINIKEGKLEIFSPPSSHDSSHLSSHHL